MKDIYETTYKRPEDASMEDTIKRVTKTLLLDRFITIDDQLTVDSKEILAYGAIKDKGWFKTQYYISVILRNRVNVKLGPYNESRKDYILCILEDCVNSTYEEK